MEARKLRFAVTCRDDQEVIGEGTHERAVIRSATFSSRTEAKRMKRGPQPGA